MLTTNQVVYEFKPPTVFNVDLDDARDDVAENIDIAFPTLESVHSKVYELQTAAGPGGVAHAYFSGPYKQRQFGNELAGAVAERVRDDYDLYLSRTSINTGNVLGKYLVYASTAGVPIAVSNGVKIYSNYFTKSSSPKNSYIACSTKPKLMLLTKKSLSYSIDFSFIQPSNEWTTNLESGMRTPPFYAQLLQRKILSPEELSDPKDDFKLRAEMDSIQLTDRSKYNDKKGKKGKDKKQTKKNEKAKANESDSDVEDGSTPDKKKNTFSSVYKQKSVVTIKLIDESGNYVVIGCEYLPDDGGIFMAVTGVTFNTSTFTLKEPQGALFEGRDSYYVDNIIDDGPVLDYDHNLWMGVRRLEGTFDSQCVYPYYHNIMKIHPKDVDTDDESSFWKTVKAHFSRESWDNISEYFLANTKDQYIAHWNEIFIVDDDKVKDGVKGYVGYRYPMFRFCAVLLALAGIPGYGTPVVQGAPIALMARKILEMDAPPCIPLGSEKLYTYCVAHHDVLTRTGLLPSDTVQSDFEYKTRVLGTLVSYPVVITSSAFRAMKAEFDSSQGVFDDEVVTKAASNPTSSSSIKTNLEDLYLSHDDGDFLLENCLISVGAMAQELGSLSITLQRGLVCRLPFCTIVALDGKVVITKKFRAASETSTREWNFRLENGKVIKLDPYIRRTTLRFNPNPALKQAIDLIDAQNRRRQRWFVPQASE